MTRIPYVVVGAILLSSCYDSHREQPDADEDVGITSDLLFGVLFDHPEGRFREVFLAEAPLSCDVVRYTSLDATGSIRDETARPYLSLVVWASRESYLFHTETTNIGPGEASVSFPPGAGPGRGRAGDTVRVTWSTADVPTYGPLAGIGTVEHCGVLTLSRP